MNPVHPFFGKPQEQEQDTTFQWLKPLGTAGTCLHGINLQPKARTKVAAFDLDDTMIKSDFKAASGKPTFEWWRPSIPDKLRELHLSGYGRQILTCCLV
jgi:bifunctional polynucleotide phosphatase/kinase